MSTGYVKLGSCDNKQDEVLCVGGFEASQKLPALSGRFVYYDISSGASNHAGWLACADNSVTIGGFCNHDTDLMTSKATSSTANGTRLPIISVKDRVFELPYAASGAASTLTLAVAEALIGKKIDLYVDDNGVQYADNATSQEVLQVEGYSVERNTLKVSVVPAYIVQLA